MIILYASASCFCSIDVFAEEKYYMRFQAKDLLMCGAVGVAAVLSVASVAFAIADQAGPADCPQIGDACDDGTVYVGSREMKDTDGASLGAFYLFTPIEDLTDGNGDKMLLTFNEAAVHVAGLRGYFGHDGGGFASDPALYRAMRDGSYEGEWFIPPKDILVDNLYENRAQGALSGTFAEEYSSGLGLWYWSLTEHPGNPDGVYVVDFPDGGGVWVLKGFTELSSRVVRAEPRP
ncbi:MAG: hypothetical protein ACRED5_03735 [Propylenella sp.]